MKLTFLGTAAAEGFPAIFCRCQNCMDARRLGGKNIRTRSQTLINDDLLIDLPADTYHHFLQNGIEGDKIAYLLVTHSHSDHLYPGELAMRHAPYCHEMRAPILQMFCSEEASVALSHLTDPDDKIKNVEVTTVRPFETFSFGSYTVTALPANHMKGTANALNYIIRQGDKTLLYAHDTGFLYDEVFAFIEQNRIRFDLVTLDCTYGPDEAKSTFSHMGIPNNGRVLEKLRAMGAVTADTVCYVNHFSHNNRPLYDELLAPAKEIGCLVSYDGCEVEF